MTEVRIAAGALALEASLPALRAALSLAAASGRTLLWESYRRRSGGLGKIEAETLRFFRALVGGVVEAGAPGETTVSFEPSGIVEGTFELAIDGREPLVPFLGAIAAPVARSARDVEVTLLGSTHAPAGATFETATTTWRHLAKRMGLEVDLDLLLAGFAPRGGGSLRLRVRSSGAGARFAPLELAGFRELEAVRIVSAAARLPPHVQQRQAARARSGIQIAGLEPNVQLLKLRAANAGSVVTVTGVFDGLPVTVSALPARSRSAESAGEEAASEFRLLLATGSLVPPPLMEPLLLTLAFAEGPSRLATWRLPSEIVPQAELVRAFTDRAVTIEGKPGGPAILSIG